MGDSSDEPSAEELEGNPDTRGELSARSIPVMSHEPNQILEHITDPSPQSGPTTVLDHATKVYNNRDAPIIPQTQLVSNPSASPGDHKEINLTKPVRDPSKSLGESL